jgi:TonB family protein
MLGDGALRQDVHMADTKALFTQRFDAARTALAVGDERGATAALHLAIGAARTDSSLRPELASALLQLGKLSRKFGAAGESEAEPLLTEALLISERLYGREHREVAPLLNELSRLHIQRSQHARAEEALNRLLAIARAQGEETADAAIALAGLALVKRKRGDEASAEPLYREALRIRENVLEPNNMVTVVTLEQLAETCVARGNVAEAVTLLRRALSTREAALGPGHASVQAARSRVSELEPKTTVAADEPRDWRPTIVPAQDDSPEPARKRRTLLYSSAGLAAVAMAGLLMLRARARGGSDFASGELSAAPRATAPVATTPSTVIASTVAGATRGDSFRSRSAATVTGAPVTQGERRASAAAASELRLPRIDVDVSPVNVPTISVPSISAAPSMDSNARLATERPRASDPDRTEPGEKVSPPASADAVDAVTPPILIGRPPAPRFPEAVLRSGLSEGQVVVRFMVDELGNVDVATMVVEQSDHELLTSAVRDILPRFRFEPARTRAPESKPVAAWVTVPFRFTTKR